MKKWSHHWLKWSIILGAFVCSPAIANVTQKLPKPDARDPLILQASEANQKNDTQKLLTIQPQIKGHPMEPWVDYWVVRSNIKKATDAEIQSVLKRWKGHYVEDRLRNDWLLLLGEREEWKTFTREYRHYVMRDDSQVLCYALLIDHQNGHDATELGRKEFMTVRPPVVAETGCNKLATVLYQQGKMPSSDIWHKARRLVELNRIAASQRAVGIINASLGTTVAGMMKDPEKWLNNQAKSANSKTPVGETEQEIITLALVRLAAKKPDEAVKRLKTSTLGKTLSAEQKAWVYGVAGRIKAIGLDAAAIDYFNQTEKAKHLNDDTELWHARARLRAAEISKKSADWQTLLFTIETMPEHLRKLDAWVYWKAIAIKRINAGKPMEDATQQQALQLLTGIAGYDGFYPQLATEELGQRVALPADPAGPTAAEMKEVARNAGLMRALYVLRLGLRSEGLREWNWNLIGKSDRYLQAAAQLACNHQVWDRCINSSERTKALFNVTQRYAMPYRDLVVPLSQEAGLEPAFVYGLIRQESRFVADIKSSVGASGLMQLMPKTASWTAKEIGMKDYKASMVTDPKTNITLGTTYLKLSMDEFDDSELLAAAAYNAGPGRPRRWRNGSEIDGAVWAENVPFNETRNYVQTVLAATVVYDLLLNSQPKSLKMHLGRVGSAAQGSKRADLP